MPVPALPERPAGVPDTAVGSFCQHDEAVFIDKVFGGKFKGFAAEVGAGDGLARSNTAHLEARGWKCLCIEPNPVFEASLRANRSNVQIVACGEDDAQNVPFKVYEVVPGNFEAYSSLKPDRRMVKGLKPATIRVPVKTLNRCLSEAGFRRLDLLSIDVEGGEAQVLDGINLLHWRPKMVILEDWDGGRHRARMCREGYYVMTRRGVNEIFLRADK